VILAVFVGWRYAGTASTAVVSADIIAQGRQIYSDQCAACHGAELEGQPDWRSLSSGLIRAFSAAPAKRSFTARRAGPVPPPCHQLCAGWWLQFAMETSFRESAAA
jgi:mono/diheme cytochrome c family protein